MGLRTLLNPLGLYEDIWLDPAKNLLSPFMTEMFMVAGKFLRFEGRESAIFLKEGLES